MKKSHKLNIHIIRRLSAKCQVFLYRHGGFLSDVTYIKVLYWLKMGKKLNLRKPQTFSEKLQWLKLYDRKPEYTQMVDKYAVKDYVAKIIGKEYIIPTLGVWNKPEDIEWETLPNQFVLKTTHGGGSSGVVICKDKASFNRQHAVAKLKESLNQDIYRKFKEWPYKNVPKRIIAEKYLDPNPNKKDIPDYKWYCFNGEPKYCQVIQDRSTKETIDFFDTNWAHQEFVGLNHPGSVGFEHASVTPNRPGNLETQIRIAKDLSKNIPFSRIDLYEIGEREYFGEITFYPMSGFGVFSPNNYNELLGQMLVLPGEKRGGVIINELQCNKLVFTKPDLSDYKFFCFNGEPKYCQVISGRETKKCIDFFDHDWNHQPFHEPSHYPFADVEPKKPKYLEKMWQAAAKLAQDKAFSRIDFYEVGDDVFFGEITFFPTSGMGSFEPEYYETIFGEMICLPEKERDDD